MIPLLVIFADAIGIFGSFMAMNIHTDITLFRFLSKAMASIEFIDIIPATIKTFFFGFFVGMIGCYKGYTAADGTESVEKALMPQWFQHLFAYSLLTCLQYRSQT
jgi:phospholipid/cholesterol/gamma-HCH transport system permease protein